MKSNTHLMFQGSALFDTQSKKLSEDAQFLKNHLVY